MTQFVLHVQKSSQIKTRHRASTEHSLTFRVRTMLSYRDSRDGGKLVGWLVGWSVTPFSAKIRLYQRRRQACNYGSHYIAVATQPVDRLQIRPIVHNQGASPTTPPSYTGVRTIVWACGRGQIDRHTHTHTHTHRRA